MTRSEDDTQRETDVPGRPVEARPAGMPRRAWRFLRRYVGEVGDDRLLGLAAEIAFFTVLGIVPGLLIAIGLLGTLDVVVGGGVAARVERQVLTALGGVLTDRAAPLLDAVQGLFGQARDRLLTVAGLGALVTVSGAFAVVIEALNLAYDVEETRSWIRRRLLGLVFGLATLFVGVLALAAIVVGPLLGGGRDLADLVGLGRAFAVAWDLLRYPGVVVGLVGWATAVFRYAPRQRSRWRDALPGALFTTTLWLAATAGLHLYVTLAARTNPVLGTFGGVAIVMIWIYLLSLALLLGGELNATVRRRRDAPPGAAAPA